MNIGMTSFGADGGKSGISQYVIQLLRQFARRESRDQVDFYLYEDEHRLYPESDNIRRIGFSKRLRRPLQNILWHQWSLQRWCRKRRHDVLFLPAGNRRLPLSAPCPTVGTVHDLSTLHVPGKYGATRSIYIRHLLPRMIRRLTRILTISENSKQDIVNYVGIAPERVTVSPLAVDHEQFYPRPPQECQRQMERWLNVPGPYIVYISRIEHPGKNHVRLIRAFNEMKRRHDVPHRLLLAGSDWTRAAAVHQEAKASPYADEILLPGFVPAERLPTLYNGAALHVFPSLYEGFGLPIVEAMASGTPTVCSNASSLPEVAGNAALMFDPYDIDSIESAMSRVLLDDQKREQLIRLGLEQAKQFTWERTANKTLEVIEEAAECWG